MATFVSDTFTDTAGTQLSSHVGETGATWAKHPTSGTPFLEITTQGRIGASGANAFYLASGVPASADYDVAWDLVVAGAANHAPRVCGRLDATANTYYSLQALSSGSMQLLKVVAGTATGLAFVDWSAAAGPTVGLTHRFVLEMRGTALRVLVDGVERIAVTDAGIAAAGRVGLRSTGVVSEPGLHIDNVSAADFGTLDTTPPAVPTGLTAAAGDAQVSLDWSDNTEGDLAGYRLYRDGVQVFDGVASAYLDSSAINGTTYSYAVSAYDTSANESTVSAAVQATPAPPGGGTGTVLWQSGFEGALLDEWVAIQQATTANMARTDTAAPREGLASARFEIQPGDALSSDGTARQQLSDAKNPDGTTRRFTAGQDLYFGFSLRLATDYPMDSGLWQVLFSWVSAFPNPLKLSTSYETNQFRLEANDGTTIYWKGPVVKGVWLDFVVRVKFSTDPAVGFIEVWYKRPTDAALVMQTLATPTTSGGTRHYFATMGTGATDVYLKAGLYRDTSFATPSVAWFDSVRAATTLDAAAPTGAVPADTTPPSVPTGLAATPGNAQVALSWTANAESDLAGYRLRRDGVQVYDGTAATFTDATVINGTTYSYTVSAYDTAGNESAQSTVVQATPAAAPAAPPPQPDPPPPTPDPPPAAPRVKRPVPNWTLVLDDHTSTEVAELAVTPTMRWEIGKATSVTFSLDQDTEAARELAGALANGIPRLRAYRDGAMRAHGHWRPQQDTADAEQATARCTFRGPFARLETRHLRAVLTRTQIDQGQILLDALAATNTIAPTGLAAGTLTPSKLRDRTYEPGKQIAELINQMTEVIEGCEFIERPLDGNPAVLALLDIAGTFGQDRSDDVRFELGQDTLSNLQGFEREIVLPVNYARVTGQEGDDTTPGPAPQVAFDQASIDKWGLYEATLALSDVTQASTLLERAQALIRADPGRTVTLSPDPTQAPQPWDEWWLGDTVGYLVDEGALVDSGTARPVALEITLDESGNETAWKIEWGEQSPSWPDGVVAALRRRLSALER